MIQAGTISTGSRATSGVAGAYWISSIRSLRRTTAPGVAARSRPTRNASGPPPPTNADRTSATKLAAPWRKLPPPVCWTARMTSGLSQGDVRRRKHVDPLADAERDDAPIAGVDFRRAVGRLVPPFLGEKKRLGVETERRLAPSRILKTMVARRRRDRRLADDRLAEAHRLLDRRRGQLRAPERGVGEMDAPIEVGQPLRDRRKTARGAPLRRVEQPVENRHAAPRRALSPRRTLRRGRRGIAFDATSVSIVEPSVSRGRRAAAQRDRNTGTVMLPRSVRVTPPRIASRMRECP